MAIDYTTTTSITDLLQNVYGEGITNQFTDEVTTYHQFKKTDKKYSPRGKGYVGAISNSNPQGVGARGEGQILPDPLTGKYDNVLIKPKFIYGAIRVSGPSMEAGRGAIAAFVDTLSEEVDRVYKSVVVDLNRQANGDGFGLLGTLSEASDALTTSSTTWTCTFDNDTATRYMHDGQIVDFYQSTAIDQSSVASRISSVDTVNNTVEMEFNDGTYKANHPIVAARSYTIATDTVASGSYMVKLGSRRASHATSDDPYEMTGLQGIFDDGTLLATFQDITVATNPKWKATLLGNSSVDRELTINLMLQALNASRTRGGDNISTMRMGLGQERKYANLLTPDVRFQPQVLKGGYVTLTFAGGTGSVEIVVDPYCTPGAIYFEPKDCIHKYEMLPLGFGNVDPNLKQRVGYDEYDQFLKIYTQLGTEKRASLTLLKDLVEPELF